MMADTDNKLFILADKLMSLRGLKEELEEQAKDVGRQINSVDFALCEAMTESKTQKFTRAGLQFILTNKPKVSSTAENKDDLITALRARGFGELVTEVVNPQTLQSFVREQMTLNDEIVPNWLDGLVSVYERISCTVRKVPKKG
jgi:hypothetical protein